ncbi:MAG TPA: hypothetical protein PL009_04775 [Flavipsychrobacter sp.]|nr:hypothetical protein [Flavipsychrobacter sp.]
MILRNIAVFGLLLFTILFSCKKWSDPAAPQDPRLDDNKYCNDPEAVNYNWNFPGQPDNSVCIFPADLFKGTYLFTDSIYNSQNVFDSARSQNIFTLQVFPIGKRTLRILGFCGLTDSLKFTAERSTYRATADTTIFLNDTTKVYGQFFCRTQDTLTGFFMKSHTDTNALKIDLQVISDTGIYFHRGTAVKQ